MQPPTQHFTIEVHVQQHVKLLATGGKLCKHNLIYTKYPLSSYYA